MDTTTAVAVAIALAMNAPPNTSAHVQTQVVNASSLASQRLQKLVAAVPGIVEPAKPEIQDFATIPKKEEPEYEILAFVTAGCAPCVKLKHLLESLRPRANVTYIDPDEPVPEGITVRYWPRSYPYTVLYRHGRLLGQWSGFNDSIKEAIQNDGN